MGQRFATMMHNRSKKLRSIAVDIVQRVYRYQLSHAEFLELRQRDLFNNPLYPKVTLADREYLRGYLGSFVDSLHFRGDLVFSYVLLATGKRVTIDSDEWKNLSTQIDLNISTQIDLNSGAHIWRSSGKLWHCATAKEGAANGQTQTN